VSLMADLVNEADPLTIQHLPGTVDGTVDRELVALVDAATAMADMVSEASFLASLLSPEIAALRAALAPYSDGDA
jgi:hypothetical protein